MQNLIAQRVADFLKRFPPFDLLESDDVLTISEEVVIKYFDKDRSVISKEDQLHPYFYLIHKGAVTLTMNIDDERKIIDRFDEGDVFGLRPLFAKEGYRGYIRTEEECILYAIPIEVFKPLAEQNRKVGLFLMESFASNTRNPYTKEYEKGFFDLSNGLTELTEELYELQPINYTKKVVTGKSTDSLQKIARTMSTNRVGSVIIQSEKMPVGIITEMDIIKTVSSKEDISGISADDIMKSPVLCYPKKTTIAQAQTSMIKHEVNHLCITKDGTPNSKIIGIVAQHDIIFMYGRNPTALMKAIKRSNSTKELKRVHKKVQSLLEGYIQQSIPLNLVSKIIFELNDATIKKVIERSIGRMDQEPPVSFAWMSVGSQSRKEQLLQTDQDNAIVFADVPDKDKEEVRRYFVSLAKKVNKRLSKIGYAYCPADMMAKNPKWTASLSEWKDQFSSWTTEAGSEEILLSSIFFDFDISYGDASLTKALTDHILEITKANPLFVSKLAASALRSASPLGFFRQFLLEEDGAYKDRFDLKKRALMPLTDAARVLALNDGLKNINNTSDRFESLANNYPEHQELYLSCSYAFKAILKFRTKHGLLNGDGGRYINLEDMTKEEKMKLKRSFKTISRLQDFMRLKFNVNQFL